MQDVPYGYCHCGCGERTRIASHDYPRYGHVKGEPVRFRPGHSSRRTQQQYEVRDCGYLTPCWVWLGAVDPRGYGRVTRSRRTSSSTLAHRVFYQRLRGPIPGDLPLDHLCRNHACVNPDHLEPVTQIVNVRRGAKVRLTVDRIHEIRTSSETGVALARRFGVGTSTVYAVRKGTSWKGVT